MPKFHVSSNVIFLYYDNLDRVTEFYERLLGLELVVDQGWAKIYQVTPHSFIGLVDGARGTHKPSKNKPVNISFETNELDKWYAHLQANGVTIFRPLRENAEIGVRGFMALDPEGYVLEFEQFLDTERNRKMQHVLRDQSK